MKDIIRDVVNDAADQAGVPEAKVLAGDRKTRNAFAQWLATCWLARVIKKLAGR